MPDRFARINTSIWDDAEFLGLSRDAKLIYFSILTHPQMTSVGLLRIGLGGLNDLFHDLTPDQMNEQIGSLIRCQMICLDAYVGLVCVPGYLDHARCDNQQAVKGWVLAFNSLPDCYTKTAQIKRLREFLRRYRKGWSKQTLKQMGDLIHKQTPGQTECQTPEPTHDLTPPPRARGRESSLSSLTSTRNPEIQTPPSTPPAGSAPENGMSEGDAEKQVPPDPRSAIPPRQRPDGFEIGSSEPPPTALSPVVDPEMQQLELEAQRRDAIKALERASLGSPSAEQFAEPDREMTDAEHVEQEARSGKKPKKAKTEKKPKKWSVKTWEFPDRPWIIPFVFSPEFKAAWASWLRHCDEHQSRPTSEAIEFHLKKCCEMDKAWSIARIEYVIARGWRALALFPNEIWTPGQTEPDPTQTKDFATWEE